MVEEDPPETAAAKTASKGQKPNREEFKDEI